MHEGTIRYLLSEEYIDLDENILIESSFTETTRSGHPLRSMQVALTPFSFITATYDNNKETQTQLELRSIYPLDLIKLEVFKKTQRQSLKAILCNKPTEYFELEKTYKQKIFWKTWCLHVAELNSVHKLWPFTCAKNSTERRRSKWVDKYLYLGSKREKEDKQRPIPLPGLGPTEDIKLFYLKTQYFGCWDQSEHWVQCDE